MSSSEYDVVALSSVCGAFLYPQSKLFYFVANVVSLHFSFIVYEEAYSC